MKYRVVHRGTPKENWYYVQRKVFLYGWVDEHKFFKYEDAMNYYKDIASFYQVVVS